MGCTPEALDVPRKVMAMNKAAMLQARAHTQKNTSQMLAVATTPVVIPSVQGLQVYGLH